MKVITAPELYQHKRLFLAGGISNCPWWQDSIIEKLKDEDVVIYNPRRKDFDINDPNATEIQIAWENQMFQWADILVFWFCKQTLNPIVLYELGKWLQHKPAVIGIEEGYTRKTDVLQQARIVKPFQSFQFNFEDFASATIDLIRS